MSGRIHRIGAVGVAVAGLVLVSLACSVESTPSGAIATIDRCEPRAFPFRDGRNAPEVTHIGLEVQDTGIVVVATVIDAQGSENLRDVPQRIGVFPDDGCLGTPVNIENDLAESGVEETFGPIVPSTDELYARIAAAPFDWPVRVRFLDIDGNVTEGNARAWLIR